MPTSLVIIHNIEHPEPAGETLVITFDELLHWIRTRRILRLPFAFSNVSLRTQRLDTLIRPFLIALILRFLSRGSCSIVDSAGAAKQVKFATILQDGWRLARDYVGSFLVRSGIHRELRWLETAETAQAPPGRLAGGSPLYLRTDMWFGVQAGGSVTHITGVLNNLAGFGEQPRFFSSDRIPLVDPAIVQQVIAPPGRFWDFPEMPALAYNRNVIDALNTQLATVSTSFIYQRYSINNFAGAWLARKHELPFVLEYNGSEIWINRHWGRPLRHEPLSTRIEMVNLLAADLIVVVSEPMLNELVQRGIPADKILVNPNGVDETRYHPALDGSALRAELGLQGRTVIGFIGTFGPWHGTEVLLEAYIALLRQHGLRESTHLLLIGDGAGMPALKQRTAEAGLSGNVTFTGLVPQVRGASYLAACDILAAPTLANPDGTPFFGSPTKLFEYMAMGKAIVASDLDQIGQVLHDERTAVLVEPGSSEALSQALARLVASPELRRMLGEAARREVCACYTWRLHTQRILDALEQRLHGRTAMRGTTCC